MPQRGWMTGMRIVRYLVAEGPLPDCLKWFHILKGQGSKLHALPDNTSSDPSHDSLPWGKEETASEASGLPSSVFREDNRYQAFACVAAMDMYEVTRALWWSSSPIL